MSGERITIEPEPTPDQEEAIRRALQALGLLEPGRPGPPPEPERVRHRIGRRDASLTRSRRSLTP